MVLRSFVSLRCALLQSALHSLVSRELLGLLSLPLRCLYRLARRIVLVRRVCLVRVALVGFVELVVFSSVTLQHDPTCFVCSCVAACCLVVRRASVCLGCVVRFHVACFRLVLNLDSSKIKVDNV